MSKIMLLILGMMLVTYIPRVLPFYIFKKLNFSDQIKKSMSYIPYAALGAMIIPDGFTAIKGHPTISLLSLCVAVIISSIKENLFISVITSVIFAYICLLII